ncbi:MAG: hypothetical protein ACRDQZ_14430 [Mycobacteriales bacterium]
MPARVNSAAHARRLARPGFGLQLKSPTLLLPNVGRLPVILGVCDVGVTTRPTSAAALLATRLAPEQQQAVEGKAQAVAGIHGVELILAA